MTLNFKAENLLNNMNTVENTIQSIVHYTILKYKLWH